MILSLVKYYKGYLRVRLTGFAPERFINLCSNHNILIWDLKNVNGAYEFYITVKGYRQIRPFVKKSKTRLKILEKFGLPFFLYRNRKRKVFFLGILFFWMILYTLSIFVWDIHIEGNYTYTEDVLINFLKEQDIHHGMFKKNVDCDEIKSLLRNEYMEITWVSAQVSGTRLLIQVKENYGLLNVPEKDQEPCDIVAKKDGIITEIITRSGIAQVKPGDVVTKGQVLVSGAVPITNDAEEVVTTKYVHSDATIRAKTVYNYEDSFPVLHSERIYTGKMRKGIYIRLLNHYIQISPFKIPFDTHDVVKEEHQLKVFANFYLPFYWGTVRFEEYDEYEDYYTPDRAFQLAAFNLKYFCDKLEQDGIKIEEKRVKGKIDKGICSSTGHIRTVEEVGEDFYITPSEESLEEVPQEEAAE